MKPTIILKQAAIAIIPYQVIFALYVQFHGEVSPGGGFQAGAIMASAFVFYSLVYGHQQLIKAVSMEWLGSIAALGVLVYIATGIAGIFSGGNFLDYEFLAPNPVTGQKAGIFLVEWGVGMSVFGVLTYIYAAFARRSNT